MFNIVLDFCSQKPKDFHVYVIIEDEGEYFISPMLKAIFMQLITLTVSITLGLQEQQVK